MGSSPSGTIALTFQRPERLPVEGETSSSSVFDVAGLNYQVGISGPVSSTGSFPPGVLCPLSAYSNITGATLSNNFGTGIVDSATRDFDPAANGVNPGPISVTVDLSQCETSGGSGYSWVSGDTYVVAIHASTDAGPGTAQEFFEFTAR